MLDTDKYTMLISLLCPHKVKYAGFLSVKKESVGLVYSIFRERISAGEFAVSG